jgi:hypothetical protein
MDESIQNFSTYEGFIQLANDELVIMNKKVVDEPEYVLESDPKVVESIKNRVKENKKLKV